MPIFEDCALPHVVLLLDLAGQNLTEHHQFYCQSTVAENIRVKLMDHPNIIKLNHEPKGSAWETSSLKK